MARSRYGLVVTPDPQGGNVWATPDGRYHVIQDYEITVCDGPHPGCPGNEEHTPYRWFVYEMTEDAREGHLGDSHETLRDAARAVGAINA